jgi:hypothetical protein
MVGCLVIDELERMWKGAVVAQFEILPCHFHGVAEENSENSQNSPSLDEDTEAGVLPTQL